MLRSEWVCDNRKCVRPSHLFLGTKSDNFRDAIAKGRWKTKLDNLHKGNKKLLEQEDDVKELFTTGKSRAELARHFGVSWSTINNVVKELQNG